VGAGIIIGGLVAQISKAGFNIVFCKFCVGWARPKEAATFTLNQCHLSRSKEKEKVSQCLGQTFFAL